MEPTKTLSGLRHLLDEDSTRLIGAESVLRHHMTEWLRTNHYLSLNMVLQNYLDIIEEHIEKLNAFLEVEQMPSEYISSRVMQGYIDEINEKLVQCTAQEVKEACLLAGIQSICHYKISSYGTAAAFAIALELKHAASIFHQAESDEKDVDQRLSHLAQHEINMKAKAPFLLTDS